MWCEQSVNRSTDKGRPAHRPVRYRFRGRRGATGIALALAFLVLLAAQVCADVQVTGNVTPARFPFNSSLGLPTAGNFIDSFYTDVNGNIVIAPAVGPLNIPGNNPTTQNNFECVLDGKGNNFCNPSSPTFDATHLAAQVNVGRTSFGEVVISGNTALRDQDLIIGGAANGTGVFRISGFGALYNNDPKILPFGWVWTNSTSATPNSSDTTPSQFSSMRNATLGYDAIVGNLGNGTLDISAGGRAEIQDALLVGDAPGAVGNVVVSGIDSFLISGSAGADTDVVRPEVPPGDPPLADGTPGHTTVWHTAIFGRQGTGTMTISNATGGGGTGTVAGATVDTEGNPQDTQGYGPIGAVLGSNPFTNNRSSSNSAPRPGGSGIVTVTGPGSRWIVGGTLQVGGFDILGPTINSIAKVDFLGTTVQYNDGAGHGTLYVNDGGLVNIRAAQGTDTSQDLDLNLAIGKVGTVQLNGGTIVVGNIIPTNTLEAKRDRVRVLNDGVITGSGRIETGMFDNRYLGRVTVGAGQTLTIAPSAALFVGEAAATVPPTNPTPPDGPVVNYGLMEMLGTQNARAELNFERSDPTGATPLVNKTVKTAAGNGVFDGGLISGQWATLRSTSGIQNQGLMTFTAGSNILQTQTIVNNIAGVGTIQVIGPHAPPGVSSPNTTLFVEGDYTGAAPVLSNGAFFQTLDLHTMTLVGTTQIQLSASNPNLMASSGDLGISGAIVLSYTTDLLNDLASHGPNQKYKIIDFGGGAYQTKLGANGINMPDTTKPIADCTGLSACFVPGLGVSGPSLAALLGPTFNNYFPVAQRIGQEIDIAFLNVSATGAMGPDFNGDGIVDGQDYAIWKANNGIPSGATVLQGDADGDGDVDGNDFLVWQRNAGHPAPWSGAGSSLGENVPEPASAAMLLSGISLVLAIGRRRRER